MAKTSENPENPGDFGTNVTRGVVLSGMSETTNSADFPIGVSVSITQTCGKPATEFEMLTYAWYALGAKMRSAEGGVGNFTPTRAGNVGTASEAQTSREIGTGCTGRKMALVKWSIMVMQAMVAALLISDVGLVFGLLIWGYGFATGTLLAKFWVVPFYEANRARRMAQ